MDNLNNYTEEKAWELGYDNWVDGYDRQNNPFHRNPTQLHLHNSWLEGWEEADFQLGGN